MSPAQTLRLKGHEFGDRIEPIEYHLAMNERVVPPPPPPKPMNPSSRESEPIYNSANLDENPLPPPPPPLPTMETVPRNRPVNNFVPIPGRMAYEEVVRNTATERTRETNNLSTTNNAMSNERRNQNNQPTFVSERPRSSIDWNDERDDKKKRLVVGFEVVENDDMNSGRPEITSNPRNTQYYKVLSSPLASVSTTPMTRYADDREDVEEASTTRMKDCLLNDMDQIWESRTKKAKQAFIPRNELEATCKPFIEKIEELRDQCMDALEVLVTSTAKKRQETSNRKSWWKFLPFGKK
jgi:hypothetical protein